MAQVRVFLPLAGTPTDLVDRFDGAPVWLPDAHPLPDDRWTTTLHGGGFRRTVAVRLGERWQAGSTHWRSISWDPAMPDRTTPSRLVEWLLPTFDGELGLHERGEAVSLVVDGRYQPPGGGLGTAVDELALHRIARSTVEGLAAGIATLLAPALPDASAWEAQRDVSHG
ncbi:MAG: hypothetical protein ACLFS9_00290 [Nitriliruptoraceae bacterium]